MTITSFLQRFYEQMEQGHIVVWTKQDKQSVWFSIDELDRIEDYAKQMSKTKDVYFGIAVRDYENVLDGAQQKKPNKQVDMKYQRGAFEGISGINCVWSDIDVLNPIAHKDENLPATFDEAKELLQRFPLEPTYLIHSGYGLQAYWLFKEPWMFDTDEERQQAAEFCTNFHCTLQKSANEKRWTLDNVADLPRIFRLPGTFNHKDPQNPREVKILEYNPKNLYDPSELEEHFLPLEVISPIKRSKKTTPKTSSSKQHNTNHPIQQIDQIADVEIIKNECPWLKHCFDDAEVLREPEWYQMLSIIGRCKNGEEVAHKWSTPYQDYSFEETDEKLHRALYSKKSGPVSCMTVAQKFGVQWCNQCKHKGEVVSPINLSKPDIQTSIHSHVANEITQQLTLQKNEVNIFEEKSLPLPEFQIPNRFFFDQTGLFYNGKSGVRERITHTQIMVIGLIQDLDEQNENILLAWRQRGEWKYLQVPRAVINNQSKLCMFNNPGYPITSTNARIMVDYLGEFMALNEDILPIYTMTNRLGWHKVRGEVGFYTGNEFITKEKVYFSNTSDEKHFSQSEAPLVFDKANSEGVDIVKSVYKIGTLEGWLEAIEPIKSFPLVQLGLYSAFVPAILDILECPNFIVDFSNRTSTGKSTVQRIAASVVGNPRENQSNAYLHTWDNTKVWVERAASALNHFPLILDDTKRARNDRDIAETLYLIANGKGRGRGTKQGMAKTKTWRTVLLSSGEMPIVEFTNDGGTRGRVLPIRGIPFRDSSDNTGKMVKQLNHMVSENYGHAYPLFIEWVVKNEAKWNEWKMEYKELVFRYSMNQNNVQGRLSDYFAAVHFTAILIHKAFKELGYDFPWDFVDVFKDIWETILEETKDPLNEEEALKEIVSWVHFRSEDFYSSTRMQQPPREGWYGRIDHDGIGIRTTILDSQLKQLGYNPNEIKMLWKGKNWLEINDGKFTKKARIGSSDNTRVVFIKKDVIDEYCN